jgi:hypothetical protein
METNPEEIQPKVAEAIGEGKLEFKEKEPELKLKKIPTEEEIVETIGLPQVVEKTIDPVLEAQTDKLIDDLLGGKLDDYTKKRYVNEMGMKYQNALANHRTCWN